MTMHLIKIQVFTHASRVTKFSTPRVNNTTQTVQLAGRSIKSMAKEPEHEKVVASLAYVGRVTQGSNSPRRKDCMFLLSVPVPAVEGRLDCWLSKESGLYRATSQQSQRSLFSRELPRGLSAFSGEYHWLFSLGHYIYTHAA